MKQSDIDDVPQYQEEKILDMLMEENWLPIIVGNKIGYKCQLTSFVIKRIDICGERKPTLGEAIRDAAKKVVA